MIIINIKFEGIDNWNRPVFKNIDSHSRYGSVNKLFGWDEPKENVIKYFKSHLDELEYFGNHFGCEPNGGLDKSLILNIIE